jgi:ubiquinone/menaquinone biosynthesis C-methylase UbiE
VSAPTSRAADTAAPQAGGLAAQFDAFHAARARTDLVARLYAQAMGEEYPHELQDSSSCDWPLLGMMTARLRLRPGQVLVDAGCGTGGTGLWLARALAVRLHGLDMSAVAVDQAASRRRAFGLPPERAVFRVGGLEHTGLPDSSAHGVTCVDALGFTADRDAAVRELGRILAPGGRLLLTRATRGDTAPAWPQQAAAAGLVVEHVDERPHEPAMWQRLYELWIAHAEQLRRDLGDDQAQRMLHEARRMLPRLPGRRAVLLTLRRPLGSPALPVAADNMTGPDRRPHDDATAPSERTSQ